MSNLHSIRKNIFRHKANEMDSILTYQKKKKMDSILQMDSKKTSHSQLCKPDILQGYHFTTMIDKVHKEKHLVEYSYKNK